MKWLLKKRNDLKNLFVLILVVILSIILEKTPVKKYVGYHKIKEYIHIEYNFFPLAKDFFGDKLFYFYQTTNKVSSNVLKEENCNDGYMVYLSDEVIYSNIIGSVISVDERNNMVMVAGVNHEYIFGGINLINVSLYQKVEIGTVLGYTETSSYYYEKN